MKLAKYLIFIVVLIGSVIFILNLDKLNTIDDVSTKIRIPGLTEKSGYFQDGMDVWQAMIFALSLGVLVGFIIALIQIISQKAELITQKSNLRKLQNELDEIRNQSLDDNIELEDGSDNIDDDFKIDDIPMEDELDTNNE